MPADPLRVLFLCTGNSARSQIAEALLQKKGGERFLAASAGTHPARVVHPAAIVALARIGIDWTGHIPRRVDDVVDQPWDLVITVCDDAAESCPVFPRPVPRIHWGIPDPAAVVDQAERTDAFMRTVAILSLRLDLMLALPASELRTAIGEQRLRAIGTAWPGHATSEG